MADSNYFIGIDEGTSTPGGEQNSKTNWVHVDGSYDNSNGAPNGNPDRPYLAILDAISNGARISVAAGNYEDEVSATNYSDVRIVANTPGTVQLVNTDKTTIKQLVGSGSTGIELHGIYIEDYDVSFIRKKFINCVIDNSANTGPFPFIQGIAQTGPCRFEDCIFMDGTGFRIQGFGSFINDDAFQFVNCTFLGAGSLFELPALPGGDSYRFEIENCDFSDPAFTIDITDKCNTGSSFFRNSNFRGTQSNSDTPANLITETNNIDIDPDYAGTPDDHEFIINGTSPLIGSGFNSQIIGAFRVGSLISLASPVENNDITVGATITITNPSTTGNIKPQFTVLDQVRKSPLVSINGVLDGTNDIPDSGNDAILPERYTVAITYKSTLGGIETTKNFIYGLPMFLDDAGVAVGEDNFNPFDISSTGDILKNPDELTADNLIDVAEIQPNFELVDK